jgi:hypothetical protein
MKIDDQIDYMIYGGTQINVAELIYDEISIHTIHGMTKYMCNGPSDLTMVVNAMLVDLQVYQYLTVSHKG